MACFALKESQDLENRAAHPHHEFQRILLPPGYLLCRDVY